MSQFQAVGSQQPADKPKTRWDKIITSTPVVMTIVATVLAGLSTSEMNQAQYFRAAAAQQQSKASDQWALFQAKRQRAADAEQRSEMFRTLGDAGPFSMDELAALSKAVPPSSTGPASQPAAALNDPAMKAAAEFLRSPKIPPVQPKIDDPAVKAAYDALSKGESETADPSLFAKVSDKSLHAALKESERRTLGGKDVLDPTDGAVTRLEQLVDSVTDARLASDAARARRVRASFDAARLRFEDARQHHEAELNQVTAYLYEISVHRQTLESERHRTRSLYFFFGMLGAQAAVTLATIAIATRERSTLWTLAAVIGVLAVAYAGYVYLFT